MTAPTVFISYSQDSDEHKDKVLKFADRLRDDGIDANLDQYQTNPSEGWQLWMEKQIRDSQFVILVCTETYLKRVMKEDEGRGKGIMWESTIVYSHLYDSGVVNEKFIPVVFGHENTKYIPTPLKPTTFYDVSTEEGYESLYRRLTNQPYTTKPELGALKKLPRRERKTEAPKVEISLAKLPSTDPTLFGRDEYLKQLDAAWDNPNINIISLVAWGGVGKTALVNKWLLQMGADNYRGAERVYGWSFYSQGAAEGRQVSADQFIAAALTWFGDPDPTQGSPWDKGERLAELIKAQRTLLILDGLEPLQSPPPVETGKIKDPGLTSLLRELARQNPGLVVISTRLAVDDLKDFKDSTAKEIDLDSLSDESGAAYLKFLGVDGTDAERQQASHEFGGHALALTLLGRYIKVVHNGDIRKRGDIPHVLDEQKQGAHARRVMESYERWLQGKPELDILRLMGLFDRPAEKGALDELREEPAIEGLTDTLQNLSETNWKYTINNLRELRLLASEDPNEPNTLDCHPLLREHFGEELKVGNPEAWRKGHIRLFIHYATTARPLPRTIEEMVPLYAAVMHGCQAKRYQEAFNDVYWKRIQRGNKYFNVKMLGAISSDLSVLSGFFDVVWCQTVPALRKDTSGAILNAVGFHLRSLGRLLEAVQPFQTGLDIAMTQENWENAIIAASNLCELYLAIGNVKLAITYAMQSIKVADHSDDKFMKMAARIYLATALTQSGSFVESGVSFREAEEIQKIHQPHFPLLYAQQGFYYCEFLLSRSEYQEVQHRANQTMGYYQQADGVSLLGASLDYLSLGRAHLIQSQRDLNHPFVRALVYINQAVDGLRQSSRQDHLPRGLLARAEYYRLTGDLVKAEKDVDEAFTIATRGGMGLHLADCHLEFARLNVAKSKASAEHSRSVEGQKSLDKAKSHLTTAKEMINRMGYHRRDKEVQELEKELGENL